MTDSEMMSLALSFVRETPTTADCSAILAERNRQLEEWLQETGFHSRDQAIFSWTSRRSDGRIQEQVSLVPIELSGRPTEITRPRAAAEFPTHTLVYGPKRPASVWG